MFGVYIQVHIKCFLTFLEATPCIFFWRYSIGSGQPWARADLPALAGPKTAEPSSLQLLSQAVSITTYYVPFGVILILFRYLHTLWGCSTKPFTNWLSCCGGKWSWILCFYCLMLTICSVTYVLWSMWCDLDLIQIPSHSVRMLNKTVMKWTCIKRYTFYSLVLGFNVAYSTQENWVSGYKTMGWSCRLWEELEGDVGTCSEDHVELRGFEWQRQDESGELLR